MDCTLAEIRSQRVIINEALSDGVLVTTGVPQGSVLRPVVCITYISDIDVRLNNFMIKSADDMKVGNSAHLDKDRQSI